MVGREDSRGSSGHHTLCAPAQPNHELHDQRLRRGSDPRKISATIMSLSKSNKMYIPFVQGQFNQGGTGALRFCGKHNLQLVISRRNPKLSGLTRTKTTNTGASRSFGASVRPAVARTQSIRIWRPSESATLTPSARANPFLLGAESENIPGQGEPVWPRGDLRDGDQALRLQVSRRAVEHHPRPKHPEPTGPPPPEIALPIRLYEFRKNRAESISTRAAVKPP